MKKFIVILGDVEQQLASRLQAEIKKTFPPILNYVHGPQAKLFIAKQNDSAKPKGDASYLLINCSDETPKGPSVTKIQTSSYFHGADELDTLMEKFVMHLALYALNLFRVVVEVDGSSIEFILDPMQDYRFFEMLPDHIISIEKLMTESFVARRTIFLSGHPSADQITVESFLSCKLLALKKGSPQMMTFENSLIKALSISKANVELFVESPRSRSDPLVEPQEDLCLEVLGNPSHVQMACSPPNPL